MFRVISLQDTDKKDIYVDENGNAYSTKLDRIYKLKKGIQTKGYEFISVRENGKKKCVLVQRLMGNAFLGLDLNSKLQMNHINRIKTDNRLCNLEIVTNRQNCLHAHGHKDYKSM